MRAGGFKSIKMKTVAVAALAALLLGGGLLFARSFRVDQVPNGRRFGCNTCHTRGGGSPRNPFGLDIENKFLDGGNVVWNSDLAALDSDGDDYTNGDELGDPEGTGTPAKYVPVSNPGDPKSVPASIRKLSVEAGGFSWLDKGYELPESGRGAVRFQAKAAVGLSVYFSVARKGAPSAGGKFYQATIGAEGNTKTLIRKNTGGLAGAETADESALLNPEGFEEFWVSVYDGLLLIGKGEPPGNVVLRWQDPAPEKEVKFAGFGAGAGSAELKNITVVSAVPPSEVKKDKK